MFQRFLNFLPPEKEYLCRRQISSDRQLLSRWNGRLLRGAKTANYRNLRLLRRQKDVTDEEIVEHWFELIGLVDNNNTAAVTSPI